MISASESCNDISVLSVSDTLTTLVESIWSPQAPDIGLVVGSAPSHGGCWFSSSFVWSMIQEEGRSCLGIHSSPKNIPPAISPRKKRQHILGPRQQQNTQLELDGIL